MVRYEVLEIENKFIKSLYPYNQWLGRKLKEDPTASLTNAPMSNGHGSSHQNYCALDDQNILLYLLNLYPPSDNIKVIDTYRAELDIDMNDLKEKALLHKDALGALMVS